MWFKYFLRGESHSYDDASQWIIFTIDSDRGADLKIAKRVQATHIFSVWHSSHITKIWALGKENMSLATKSIMILMYIFPSPAERGKESHQGLDLGENLKQLGMIYMENRCIQTLAHPTKMFLQMFTCFSN